MKNFKSFLKEYQKQLKSASKTYAYKYNFIDSDDLFQEALIVLLKLHSKYKKKYEEEDKFKEELWGDIRKCFRRYIYNEKTKVYPLISLDVKYQGEKKLEDTLVGEEGINIGDFNFINRIQNFGLTKREEIVLKLRLRGWTQKEIALNLRLNQKTISRLCKKIGEELKK